MSRNRNSTGMNIAPTEAERELVNAVKDMVAERLKLDSVSQKGGIMWAVRIAKHALENDLIENIGDVQ